MRPRRLRIHTGGSNCSALESKLHVLFHLGDIIDFQLQKILNKNSLIRTFLEIHPSLGVLTKQVVYFLIVDFDKTATDEMILGGIILGHRHDLAEGTRNDTLGLFSFVAAHHGVSLTATGLPIGENGSIVAVQHVIN